MFDSFINQRVIKTELTTVLLPRIAGGENINILLQAPSGYGKTQLGLLICNFLGLDNASYRIPNRKGRIQLDLTKRVQFLDEIHTFKTPELLYPLLDSRNHVFILGTNEDGNLKEPLMNRCINFIFSAYTVPEIATLINKVFKENGISASYEILAELAEKCSLNPRIAKQLAQRLSWIFSVYGIPQGTERLNELLDRILGVNADGLNEYQRRYLDYLRKVKRASLDTIANYLRVQKATILRDIEPLLIYKGMIEITNKGRIIK